MRPRYGTASQPAESDSPFHNSGRHCRDFPTSLKPDLGQLNLGKIARELANWENLAERNKEHDMHNE